MRPFRYRTFIYKSPQSLGQSFNAPDLVIMTSCLLLALLLVGTISAEITCWDQGRVPSTASCDVALQHLSRYLLPCLYKETVIVSETRDTADIRLPVIFADKSDQPPETPTCFILFTWNGDNYQSESIQPGKLQTFATNMKNQCIAASPPQMPVGEIEPNRWIIVTFETLWANGNLTIPGVNGTLIYGLNDNLGSELNNTLIPVNRPPVNPTNACRGPAEASYGVELDGPQPSVETS